MKKVAIYVRVSTSDQAEEGYSVDEQIDKLTKYCDIKDWHVYEIYKDPGFTGSNLTRPGLNSLIYDSSQRRFDTVLVYKLDRLSRSQKDTLYLIEDVFAKSNVDFVSLSENFDTSSAFGKAMIGILSVFAQLEREQITERMQMGKVGRARSGKAMSWTRPPFGYTYEDSNYVVNEFQATIVKAIYAEYLSGTSITKLRDKMNIEGHIGKDIKWSYRAIRLILDNPVYAGSINFKGEVYVGNHEAIISKKEFDDVQKQLEIRQKQAYANNNNPRPFQGKYLLSGLLRCDYCGAPLAITLGNIRKDGSRLKKYQCMNRISKSRVTTYNNNEKCNSDFYQLEDLEEYVINEVSKLQLNPNSISMLSNKKTIDQSEVYEKRLLIIDKKIKKLSDLYMNDLLSLEDMQFKAKVLQDERKSIIKIINNSEEKESNLKIKTATDFLESTEKNIKDASYENQKTIINGLIKKVDVNADKINVIWRF